MIKSRSKVISISAAIITMLIGMLATICWLVTADRLCPVVSNILSMKFNLALSFVLLTSALLLQYFPKKNKIWYRISVLLSSIVCLIGLVTFAEYFFGIDIGIDDLFVRDKLNPTNTSYPGRMSPLSAVNLLLVGTGLFILNKEKTASYQFFYLSGIVFISLMMAITFNFITDIPTFISLSVYDTIGFTLLCVAIYFAQPMLQKKISFEQKLFTQFGAIIILILVLSIFSSYYSLRRVETNQWLRHTNTVIDESKEILSRVKDIEGAVSGYLITGDSGYLQNLVSAKDDIFYHGNKLKALTKDNPPQQIRIDSLLAMIEKQIGFFRQCIKTKNEEGFDSAKLLVTTGRDRYYGDSLRKISLEIQQGEDNLLNQREKENRQSIVSFDRAFLVLLGGILILFIIIIFSIRRNNIVRKKAEGKIKESEHMFSMLFRKSPVLKAIIEKSTGKYIKVNDAFVHFLRNAKEDVPGKICADTGMPDNTQNLDEIIKNIENKNFVREVEMQLESNNGKLSWISASIDMVNLNGKDCFLLSGIDITKRKIAEDNLLTLSHELKDLLLTRTHELDISEKSYHHLFENNPLPMWVMDLTTFKFLDVNEMAILQYGYSRKEFFSMNTIDIMANEDKKLFNESDYLLAINTTSHTRKVWNHMKKDGTIMQVEIIGHRITFGGLPAQLILSNDITERKKAEEQLLAIEQQFRYTLDNMLEGAQIIGFDWRYKYVNDSMTRHAKYSREELIGHTVMEKYPGIEKSGIYKFYQQCLDERVAIHVEIEFTFPDKTTGWFELSFQPVTEGIFILSIDITERKKAQFEIQKLNQELEHKVVDRTEQLQVANKELEAFSYSISHDLRAPLRAINGFAKKLEQNYSTSFDNEGQRLFSRIKVNAIRMGLLIDNLLEFSRLGRKELHKSMIPMTRLVESTLMEINTTVHHEAVVKIDQLHCANADIALIKQVMINLLSNAIKYSSKTEKPSIEIKSLLNQNEIIYTIKDNGIGFNNQYADKLFGVFQRLHLQSDFEGVGVGLALVKRIIDKHGGRVWADGELNKGATFSFSLPTFTKDN